MIRTLWSKFIDAVQAPAPRHRRRDSWGIEQLEDRLLLTTYTPAQVAKAYGFDQVYFGNVKGDGTGQTIAIVGAYDTPNIVTDLAKFNSRYGLPNTDGAGGQLLTVANPSGKPAYDQGWAQEATLDVQWAHAIAPGAHILLVQAASNGYYDMMAAVDYARKASGVSVVSMSWGSTEFPAETQFDSYFTTPAGKAGVSFVAAAGDVGAVPNYPAVSPNVLAVGGTTLMTVSGTGTWSNETTWTSSGGGISAFEPRPEYQAGVTQSSTHRTTPDVAFDANPSTGVGVYFTGSSGTGSWYTFGGTSVGAPQWAALIAIVDQGRAIQGLDPLDGRTQLLPAIYDLPSSDFHDITSGSAGSGSSTLYAGPGYDLVTGRGTPIANRLIPDLVTAGDDGSIGGAQSTLVGNTTISLQSGALTYGTSGTATYTVTVNRGSAVGEFDVDLSLTSTLPAGASYQFTVGGSVTDLLHFGAGDNTLTATLRITSGTGTPAGAKAISIRAESLDSSGNTSGDFATSTGTLTIGKRVLTVSASGNNKAYDGTTSASVTLSDNRVAGDTLSIGYASASFTNKNAGTARAINVSGITLSGADAGNYTFNTTATTTGDITARAITVTAVAKTKIIGDSDPALAFQVTSGSLAGGDSFSGNLERVSGESMGGYAIQQGTLTAGSNYAITYVGATLTIAPYNLAGAWVVNGQSAQVQQNGASLTFTDPNGTSTSGQIDGVAQVTGRGGLVGTIDVTTADRGRIVWSDGSIWLRVSPAGRYFNPANKNLTVILQAGSQLYFVNAAGQSTAATFTSPTQFSIPGWNQTATFVNGVVTFSGGSSWRKLDLSPAYMNAGGAQVGVRTSDSTTNLVFVNATGGTSNGGWISSTQVAALEWGVIGTVANGQINWSNGTVWKKNLLALGSGSGSGQVSISAVGSQITLTNRSGESSRAQVTGANTLVALDWGGMVGTVNGDRIVWANGTYWNNFNYNALDAVFADIRNYPFGA